MSGRNVQLSVGAHVATVLGYHYGTDVTSAILAESVNADPSFVRRTVSKLAKAGLVHARPGRHGACSLAHDPANITLLDVYRACDASSLFLVHQYPAVRRCPISSTFKPILGSALLAVQRDLEVSLSRVSIAQLVANVHENVSTASKSRPPTSLSTVPTAAGVLV
jgi:DNA-binding IscR family transcriptional regulator